MLNPRMMREVSGFSGAEGWAAVRSGQPTISSGSPSTRASGAIHRAVVLIAVVIVDLLLGSSQGRDTALRLQANRVPVGSGGPRAGARRPTWHPRARRRGHDARPRRGAAARPRAPR